MSGKGNGQGQDVELSGPAAATEEIAETGLEVPAAEGTTPEAAGEAAPGDELETLRREVAELRATLLRRRADFENYKKRVERDRGTAAADAEAGVLRQLLGTVDNLERALAAPENGSGLRDGVVLTHRELVSLLESMGVQTIDPLGEPFDPGTHEAILHEPVAGFAAGTVAAVFRKGFRHRDRLLRPALVKVASGEGDAGRGDDGTDVQ
jgi:molecular chaperone GrpE